MRLCLVGVRIEQGSRNGTTNLNRDGVVPCRPASHAGREQVWGSGGERRQMSGGRCVDQANQEVVSFLCIRIIPPPSFKCFFRQGKGRKELFFFVYV